MISAEKGYGVDDLRRWLAERVPAGPWLYPEDQIADAPLRMIAAEMTREKLTLRLHQELPYAATVETEDWEERKDGSVRIDQVIYVARDGHKGIVLGKGETIKAIGQAAREEIAASSPRQPVHLFLTVKVRPNWLDEAERYGEMGLEIPARVTDLAPYSRTPVAERRAIRDPGNAGPEKSRSAAGFFAGSRIGFRSLR